MLCDVFQIDVHSMDDDTNRLNNSIINEPHDSEGGSSGDFAIDNDGYTALPPPQSMSNNNARFMRSHSLDVSSLNNSSASRGVRITYNLTYIYQTSSNNIMNFLLECSTMVTILIERSQKFKANCETENNMFYAVTNAKRYHFKFLKILGRFLYIFCFLFIALFIDGQMLTSHDSEVDQLTKEIEHHDHLMADNATAEQMRM